MALVYVHVFDFSEATSSISNIVCFQGNELASLTGHSDRVVSAAVSNKGCLVTGSLDNTVRIWNIHDGSTIPGSHNAPVSAVASNRRGTLAATASRYEVLMPACVNPLTALLAKLRSLTAFLILY